MCNFERKGYLILLTILIFTFGIVWWELVNEQGLVENSAGVTIKADTSEVQNPLDVVNEDDIRIVIEDDLGGHAPEDNEPRFSIQYDGSSQEYMKAIISDIIKKAHYKICSDLNHYPESRTTIILYSTSNMGDGFKYPDWSVGLYDGKIRIQIGNPLDTLRLRRILFHEYTHVVVDSVTRGNCPTWIQEGLAMYEEGTSEAERGHFLASALKQDSLIPLVSLNRSFLGLEEDEAQLAYAESFSAMKYLVDTYGLVKVREILELLATNSSIDFALRSTINLDYSQFEDEWRQYLMVKYRG